MKVGDAQIEYNVRGNGESNLLLLHGGLVSDAFEPLASVLARSSSLFRIVSYHRRGYGGSSRPTFPFSIEGQAQDCLSLMDTLGLDRAHLVGHSMSGLIALQLATNVPERIASLVLIEPSLIASIPSAAQSAQVLSKFGALYQSGNKNGALDNFMQGTSGQQYRKLMDPALRAGWFEGAVKNLDTFFLVELPSIRSWKLESLDRVKQPILSIYGMEKRWGDTLDSGAEFDQLLHLWFPQTESLPIPRAYHWPHVTNTTALATAITGFVKKNAR